jgi:hypothetical protein
MVNKGCFETKPRHNIKRNRTSYLISKSTIRVSPDLAKNDDDLVTTSVDGNCKNKIIFEK